VTTRGILVVGVGNVFRGDDGFGPQVAAQLERAPLPAWVTVRDFGIRGLHLAYELLDPPARLIIVDVVSRGDAPGTLYVIEPFLDGQALPDGVPDAHGVDLSTVFATLRGLGGTVPPVLVVGCEPATLDEAMGLSAPVEAAVEPAVRLVHTLLQRELATTSVGDARSGGVP
jgi:hydrogenase maturation protease